MARYFDEITIPDKAQNTQVTKYLIGDGQTVAGVGSKQQRNDNYHIPCISLIYSIHCLFQLSAHVR